MQHKAQKFTSGSVEETMAIAQSLAGEWGPGAIICLSGELGTGKTHFVKGAVRAFGIDPNEVQSPTFTLINQYEGELPVYHFDCYRLEHAEEFLEIGAEDYLYSSGISLIEWPEKIQNFLPVEAVGIFFKTTGKQKRELVVEKSFIKADL